MFASILDLFTDLETVRSARAVGGIFVAMDDTSRGCQI
jgi:hypothetical protein